MAILEGSADYFVRQVGRLLGDYTITRSADGTCGRSRTMHNVNEAHKTVQRFLSSKGIQQGIFARKATLTQDSTYSDIYYLPARAVHIFSVQDGSDALWFPINSRNRPYDIGFHVEKISSAGYAGWQKTLHFQNCQPNDTLYAWVLEEPVRLSAGDGTYAATSITLEGSPDLGETIPDANYYVGADVAVCQDSAAALGATKEITASTTAGVCTVATWAVTPTASDDYSILTSMPRETWELICVEAAIKVAREDKTFESNKDSLREQLMDTRLDTILNCRKLAEGLPSRPREAEVWIV